MHEHWNEETHKREWVLFAWYHKLAFILGWLWLVLLIFGFVIGFVEGWTGY